MGRAVDGRPARVDADSSGVERDERSRLARQRVVQAERHRTASTVAIAERRDRPSGALGAVEVAGRRLDVDRGRVEPEEAGDRVAHRVEMGAEPRPGGDDRQIDARRSPAGGLDPAPDVAERGSLLAIRAVVRASAGKRRPRSPSPAAPSSASRDGVEDDVAVGVADQARRARRSRPRRGRSGVPGPNGWLSWPMPGPRRAGRAEDQRPPAARSAGSVTLRLPGSPGTTWTSMLQASSRAASSVNVSGPSAGNRR